MKSVIRGTVVILFTLLTLTGCGTDNSTLLTDGVWTFQSMTTDSDESNIISLVSLGQALLTEATMEFQEGGSYILTSPLVANPTTGEWQLVGEEQLILDPDGEASSTSNIETLTKDRLSYVETFEGGQVNPYKVTTTWVR